MKNFNEWLEVNFPKFEPSAFNAERSTKATPLAGRYKTYAIQFIAKTPKGKWVKTWTYGMGRDEQDAINSTAEFLQDNGMNNVNIIQIQARVPGEYASKNMPPVKTSGSQYKAGANYANKLGLS